MSGKLQNSLRQSWQYQDNSHLSLIASFLTAKTDMNACKVSSKSLWAHFFKTYPESDHFANLSLLQPSSNIINYLGLCFSWVSLSPNILLPLISWSGLFQYEPDHLIVLCTNSNGFPSPSGHYPKPLPWSHPWLFLRHFSVSHMPSWVLCTCCILYQECFSSGSSQNSPLYFTQVCTRMIAC